MMYSKTLSALLLLAPAVLATPVVTGTPSDSNDFDLGISDSEIAYINSFVNNIPTSIRSVLETAVPVSWYMNLVDPAVQSSVISQAEAGIYPDWYSALPSSVIAWASSVAQDDDSLFASATATDDDMSLTSSTATGNTVSATATATATATQTESKSAANSKTVTGSQTEATTATSATDASGTASTASSTAASSTASSATSTGGAPLATGGVAMSLAGAAGLLGLAVML